ncbi:maleylacetate reductase [Comamonas testosteroni]|jgi:maleylacetate reductase|uniref:maleylacetate reductase n=1 Tax=Comamonas testosteroni (strain DSM 14576 / KF-1) TaxID=399795 RepID=B7X570_COMTK|nr:maleylacetate reductase [Comamonas testosteroni]EED70526.1 iron-containing alcohol dehydrogenase [Comamonas testosteroni KF-1]WQG68470.1 maleylacetate reductase [Comamonas testosteroni]
MSNADRTFVYTAQPSRVVFGRGSLGRLADEVKAVGAQKALVLCTPEQRKQAQVAADLLGPLSVGIYDGAQMHVPIESARKAREYSRSLGADCMVAIGGGSTIGLGKAIALESTVPIIAVPTTYAGSEMTPIYGITEDNVKKTGRDLRVLPKTVLYDPDLSATLPVRMSMVSGMNAIAHAAEGLYAKDGNPVMSLMAEEGIRALATGMRGVFAQAGDMQARSDCLYGAWLCGSVLGHVGMALHHKLCHTLGGTFNLPHAETHTIVLPHALAYNTQAAPEAMQRVARAIGASSAAAGLFDLAKDLGAPTALRDIGFKESDIEVALKVAMSNPYWNPEPIVEDAVRELLRNAWEGRRPSV